MFAALHEVLEDLEDRLVLGHVEQVATQSRQRRVVRVVGDLGQRVAEQDVARDVVSASREDRVAGERTVRVHHVLGRAVLGERHHDGARGHDVGGNEALEPEEALEQPGLACAEDAFLRPDVGQRRKLLTADVALLLPTGEQLREPLRHDHQRVQQVDQRLQQLAHQGCQATPVHRPHGLGDDLAQDEDGQRQDGGEHADRPVAEVGSGLRTGTGGTDGVGDGVERQDRRERSVHVVLQLAQPRRNRGLRRLQRTDVGGCDAEQHRLHDRAEERHADRHGDVDDQERERPGAAPVGGHGCGSEGDDHGARIPTASDPPVGAMPVALTPSGRSALRVPQPRPPR